MIDWFKIVRASWITKFMWNTKYFPWRFCTSETPKLSNKDGFMLFFNCRKRRSNLQSFSLHLTNHRSSHGLLCLTHLFNSFATIVCWDPRIYAKRFVLRTFYSKFNFFCDEKVCLIMNCSAFAPYLVRPYLMPCSPPHFSSFTPSSRVRPLIEWYPDELICDEGTSRMCQMSRQRRPFWISAIAILCAGSGNTRNNCIHWTCDKENHT